MKKDLGGTDRIQAMTKNTFEIFHYKGCGTKRLGFHSHDFFEMYIFMGGNVSYFIEEKRYDLQLGDILLIPPGQIHRLDIHGTGENYERTILWINPTYIRQLDRNGASFSECLSSITGGECHHYRMNRAVYKQILIITEELFEEIRQNDFGSEFLIGALFIELLVRIGREFRLVNQKKPINQADSIIPKIISFINDNFTSDITILDLTHNFFISKSYLLREFKKYTQCTVYEYVIMKRLSHFKKLVGDGVQISEACLASGFNDYSCFFKAFKKANGISPKEYTMLCKTADYPFQLTSN